MSCATHSPPKPNFSRDTVYPLEGNWKVALENPRADCDEKWFDSKNYNDEIRVPHGVAEIRALTQKNDEIYSEKVLWYHKGFHYDKKAMTHERARLHFGAVDYQAKVWVNRTYLGEHIGGYTPFSFDITEYINDGENEIVVRVFDDSGCKGFPRGKQTWHKGKFGCWYENYSGIWQPVWLENIHSISLCEFFITPDVDKREISIEYSLNETTNHADEPLWLDVEVLFDGAIVAGISSRILKIHNVVRFAIENDAFDMDGMHLWSPENPELYDIFLTVRQGNRIVDRVKSYFGMRKISTQNGNILLNNRVYYSKLVLYQGYYESGFFIGTDGEYQKDINAIKQMGYNGIRIHEKIENPRFLYWCDRLGLIVWEEMPSCYSFGRESIERMTVQLLEAIKRDYNNPCICVYVLFNESWGISEVCFDKRQQHCVDALYHLAKSLDETRLVIGNDGWEHTLTDICTIHDYTGNSSYIQASFKCKAEMLSGTASHNFPRYIFANGYKYSGQPIIISEYGGIAFASDEGWGYNEKVGSQEEFLKVFSEITETIKSIPYVDGYCYTQFNDVEHETNGLVTMQRIPKVPIAEICSVNDKQLS